MCQRQTTAPILVKGTPTASTESVFIAGMIDAKENRDVAVVVIPGAFLQISASDDTIIKLQGAIVKVLLK